MPALTGLRCMYRIRADRYLASSHNIDLNKYAKVEELNPKHKKGE